MLNDKDRAALAEINERFVYTGDRKQYGTKERWKIIKQAEGPLKGDCEDYSLTLLWYMSGKSKLRFVLNLVFMRGVLWHCTTANGGGHAMLRYKKHWVDNIHPEFRKDPIHKRWFPYLFPLVALKFILSWVLDALTSDNH